MSIKIPDPTPIDKHIDGCFYYMTELPLGVIVKLCIDLGISIHDKTSAEVDDAIIGAVFGDVEVLKEVLVRIGVSI